MMEQEILTLLRENNEMLKRICAYVEKVDDNNYRDNEDAKQLIFNIIADLLVDNNQRQQRLDGNNNNNNQQVFWR